MSSKLKEIYETEFSLKKFYTGGDVKWTLDGKTLLCLCGGSVQFLDIESGKVVGFIGEEEIPTEDIDVDIITTFTTTSTNDQIFTAHKSGLMKIWSYEDKCIVKHWRSVHKGPVAKLAVSSDGTVLISGGSDSSVRIWDLKHYSCTKNLTGINGVCRALKFLEGETATVIAVGDDSVIKCWDVKTGEEKMSLTGPYSTVSEIVLTADSKYLISCSRDKVIIVWDLEKGKQLNVIPTYETLESMVILPNKIVLPGGDIKHSGSVYVATGGDKGVIRVWDVLNSKELYVQNNSFVKKEEERGLAVTHLLYSTSMASFAVVSWDHNIIIHSFDSFICTNQFVGYSDEIMDIVFVGKFETHMAVATNSPDIKLFKLTNMNCNLLTGHNGFVVTLAVANSNPNIFASASKDNSIKIWKLCEKVGSAVCIASGMYHNAAVCGLSFSFESLSYVLSGAEDNIIKMWEMYKNVEEHDGTTLMIKASCLAHEKDINAIAVAPNDKIIATGSLDKTAKLWEAKDLSLIGTLRGHRRGIWSITFSPVDQVLMTCSADTTIKLWNVADLSCLKTFEGHTSSVMKAAFLSHGLQIISVSGDGLMKLWTIKTSECNATFDGHDGKIWALAVSKDESHITTGCSMSKIVFWKDKTEENKVEKMKLEQGKVEKEQELFNLIQSKQYLSALKIALSLDRPQAVLSIVKSIIKNGGKGLEETVLNLEDEEKLKIFNCAAHWNTKSKDCLPAQYIFKILMSDVLIGKLKVPASLIEAIVPYTQKHFDRLTQLQQDLTIIDYALALMKSG